MKTCPVHAPRGACRTAQVIQTPCFARPRPRPTLSEAGQAWLAASEGRLKPSTLSIYAGILRAHIDPALGQRPLHALSGREIEAFLCEKAAPRENLPGLAPRTVSNISTVLHGISDPAGHSRTSLVFGSPKSPSSDRVIPMPHFLHRLAGRQRRDDGGAFLYFQAGYCRIICAQAGISVDAGIHDAPQGDVPFCVKQFFSGMSEEEASRYSRLCEDAQKLHEKT